MHPRVRARARAHPRREPAASACRIARCSACVALVERLFKLRRRPAPSTVGPGERAACGLCHRLDVRQLGDAIEARRGTRGSRASIRPSARGGCRRARASGSPVSPGEPLLGTLRAPPATRTSSSRGLLGHERLELGADEEPARSSRRACGRGRRGSARTRRARARRAVAAPPARASARRRNCPQLLLPQDRAGHQLARDDRFLDRTRDVVGLRAPRLTSAHAHRADRTPSASRKSLSGIENATFDEHLRGIRDASTAVDLAPARARRRTVRIAPMITPGRARSRPSPRPPSGCRSPRRRGPQPRVDVAEADVNVRRAGQRR